jgi:ATP-binding cassette, subfamily G (WHITE), member 2, PDR
MYRVSPFTYWIGGMIASLLHARPVICTESETSRFPPPSGQTCGEYLADFLRTAPGTLQNPNSTDMCNYCSLRNADQFLAQSRVYYSERWRDWGLVWAYVLFDIALAVLTYYLFRVAVFGKKGEKKGGKAKKGAEKAVQQGAAPPNRQGDELPAPRA